VGQTAGEERAALKARQGVNYTVLEELSVRHPESLGETPWDGETIGEVMFRGNVVMKGYLKNPGATEAAFAGGQCHSGDLGVRHPDGHVELKPGTGVDERELIDFCRERLAHFKCPTRVLFTELPKTSTGKIQKFELRKRVQEGV